jgi:hypothetical protein
LINKEAEDTKMKKIDIKQLQNIILEEIETLAYEEQKITADQAESAELAKDKAEDLEAVEDAWAGGPNLVHAVHWGDEAVDDDVQRGQEVLTVAVVESILKDLIESLKD